MLHPANQLIRKCFVSVASRLFMIALALAGCAVPTPTDPPDPDAGPPPCAPGELTRDDGTCQPAGLPPDMPCPPGELLLEDGVTCQKAGLPDMPCPPGELLLADGATCQKAGVPPSACGAGFLPDGKDGCEPILPDNPCPEGQMAVPGDTVCREVAPCGDGTWGDIPVEANTQFVDKSYAGGDSDGTQAKPWTTIQQGVNAAADGAIVAVAAGSYPEDVLIQGKPVRLWGRCPALVEVVGTGTKLGAIQVLYKAAGGAEIHTIAATGATLGIGVSGASNVVIEGAWVYGATIAAVDIQNDLGPTSVLLKGSLLEQNQNSGVLVVGSKATIEATVVRSTLGDGILVSDQADPKRRADVTVRGCLVEQSQTSGVFVVGSDATIEATVVRSSAPGSKESGQGIDIVVRLATGARANVTVRACLVEQSYDTGVFVLGSDARIEGTVVRSTLLNAQGEHGQGIHIEDHPATNTRSNVTVRECLVEKNHEMGVFVLGSDATIEGTLVRSTSPNALGEGGNGVGAQHHLGTSTRANVTVRACIVEQSHDLGVLVMGSDASIEATVVRSTQPNANGKSGRGIAIQEAPDTKARSNATVRACLVEQNHELGVHVGGSDVTIEATVVRSTQPNALGEGGRGIEIEDSPMTEQRADVTVRACLIEKNHEIGVFVAGSDATIEATVVRSTLPSVPGKAGRGINIQHNASPNARSNATVRACLVEQNHDIGVYVALSDVTIEASLVRDIAAQKSDNKFGDGIAVFEGNVAIEDVHVTRSARAGVASFGGQVVITGGVITCNAVGVEGEPLGDIPFSFEGSTGWQCSDPAAAECTELGGCYVETTGLEAPSELPPADSLPQ